MRWLELRVPPPAVTALAAAAMAALAWARPAPMPLRVPVLLPGPFLFQVNVVAGIVVALAGVLVTTLSATAILRRKTTLSPFSPEKSSAIVTTGPYRLSRNPIYLGLLMVLAGWSLYLASWASLLVLPAFVAYMNRFQILPEERVLAARFGAAFDAYLTSVGRWI